MSDLRVAFRVSVPTTMTNRPLMGRDHWSDQPTPPPPAAHEYTDPPEPFYRVWPPLESQLDKGTAQQRRIKQTLFMLNPEYVQLDPERSRYTYTRCTLVGTVILRDHEWSRSSRWTGYGYRPLGAMDAAGTVLLALRSALMTVYEIRPENGTMGDLPLPGLSISLREVR